MDQSISSILIDIESILSSFGSIVCFHVPSRFNGATHGFAKLISEFELFVGWGCSKLG